METRERWGPVEVVRVALENARGRRIHAEEAAREREAAGRGEYALHETRLKLQQRQARQRIDLNFLRQAKFDALAHAADHFIEMIWRDRVPVLDGDRLTVPATWWDHFKRDGLPPRFRRLFRRFTQRDVQVRTETFQAVNFVEGLALPPDPRSELVLYTARFRREKVS